MTRPSECVKLRQNPINCWNLMTFKPPATFRLRAPMPKDPGNPMLFQVFNYRSGLADMLANLGIGERGPHQSLKQVGQSLVEQMGVHQDPANPVKWEALTGGESPGIISSTFDGAHMGDRSVPVRFALLELDERKVALCIFVFATRDKDDQEIFRNLAESMSKTIRPLKQ